MVSRIDIGPDGGPYVAINENSNDLELQDINGNVIAKWDETEGQWDLNNNSLTGINAIDAGSANVGSLSTDSLGIGSATWEQDANSPFDAGQNTLASSYDLIKLEFVPVDTSGFSVSLTVNDVDDGYDIVAKDGSEQEGASEIEFARANALSGDVIMAGNPTNEWSASFNIGSSDSSHATSTTNFDVDSTVTSIGLITDGDVEAHVSGVVFK